jgi:hypothetical protein
MRRMEKAAAAQRRYKCIRVSMPRHAPLNERVSLVSALVLASSGRNKAGEGTAGSVKKKR